MPENQVFGQAGGLRHDSSPFCFLIISIALGVGKSNKGR